MTTTATINALDLCNVCDEIIEMPNPAGYCDEHLAETLVDSYIEELGHKGRSWRGR